MTQSLGLDPSENSLTLMTKKPLPEEKNTNVSNATHENENGHSKHVFSTQVFDSSIRKPHACAPFKRTIRIVQSSK